jgi:hypothetical protein
MSARDSPVRRNTVDFESLDTFGDRRLSDLLPREIVRQIGFDPDSYLFGHASIPLPRRMTDPVQFVPIVDLPAQPRQRDLDFAQFPAATPPAPLQIVSCFLVELSDQIVHAFSTFPIPVPTRNAGVILQDGIYHRLGRISEEIRGTPTITPTSLQIVGRDKDAILSDYLNLQTELAGNLAKSFLVRARCPAQFVSIEPVSFRSRTLFRLKVSDADAPNLEEVARLLIQAFSVGVEIYD